MKPKMRIAASLTLALLSGCAAFPVWLNGTEYGAPGQAAYGGQGGSMLFTGEAAPPSAEPPEQPRANARSTAPPHQRAPMPPAKAAPPSPVRTVKTYFVPVTSMPWVWQAGGKNQAYRFGYPNGTPPVIIPLARLGAPASVTIQSAGGTIAIGQGAPPAGAGGYAGLSGGTGPLGAFPDKYMQAGPLNLGALIGVFTDAAGNILRPPFAIGTGKTTQKIPPGATQLQLGINDDVFGGNSPATRNTGGFDVRVTPGGS